MVRRRGRGGGDPRGGGHPGGDLEAGFYYAPTLVDAVSAGMDIAQEEVFGRCSPSCPSTTRRRHQPRQRHPHRPRRCRLDGDVGRAHRVAAAVRAGTFWINGYKTINAMSPFGGFGASGYGRSSANEALLAYTRRRASGSRRRPRPPRGSAMRAERDDDHPRDHGWAARLIRNPALDRKRAYGEAERAILSVKAAVRPGTPSPAGRAMRRRRSCPSMRWRPRRCRGPLHKDESAASRPELQGAGRRLCGRAAGPGARGRGPDRHLRHGRQSRPGRGLGRQAVGARAVIVVHETVSQGRADAIAAFGGRGDPAWPHL
jgi:hypothetical protein